MEKVKTYLPVFPGFYSTIFEPDESLEISNINEEREQKGLSELGFDAFEFDYDGYKDQVCRSVTSVVERQLKDFVTSIDFEELISPRFYNYSNDSINVIIKLSNKNVKAILSYLETNKETFAQYLRDNYTSSSGFISHYDNDIARFMADSPLEHKHKLGSILNFICESEGITQETLYYGMEAYLSVKNYSELIGD